MPAPGRYLLQETPLYYYTSASLMQFTRTKEQAGTPTIFAMGNPDFQDRTLSLPYAAREARGIATLFPDNALAIGGLLASFIGTTGAAMLLIRPLLETNRERKHVKHTVIFFTFIALAGLDHRDGQPPGGPGDLRVGPARLPGCPLRLRDGAGHLDPRR